MVRASRRLLQTLVDPPVSHKPALSPLIYNLGLSYASKSSPPFISPDTPPPKYGFASESSRIGRWVDEMLTLRAGRGELQGGVEGGWTKEMQLNVRKWGAGEDFFGVVDGGGFTHLALSDGVGGWAPQVDPSLFAQALMYHYAKSATSSPSSSPWDILKKGYEGVLADDSVTAGSGTAVAITLSDNGELKGVNLGDSGLVVMRKDSDIYDTPVQTHYFNCPLQLTKAPAGSEGLAQDKPEEGFRFQHSLEPGDAVILFTDGLSDNLPNEHLALLSARITALLNDIPNTHLTLAEYGAERARLLADVLVGYARNAMQRTGEEKMSDGTPAWRTPFEIEAEKHGYKYLGGKVDDITVMTAIVSERI